MPQTRNVAVLVGSLRKDSYNRKMARALAQVAPEGLKLEIVEIGQLPHYNQDDEANPPAASAAFRQKVAAADAVLFVTPEYNRSVPGVLKNAIDVGSRPYGKSVCGGFGANHHLRQSLVFLDMPALAQPEAYVGGAGDLFDESGGFKKPETRQFAEKFMTAFAAWIERNPKPA